MSSTDTFQLWYPTLLGGLFFFALGANVGSFINVLAYRLPLGKSVVSPPSSCPACGTRVRWYDNVPILGWLALRGRCRYCKTRISIEYPIVESVVALLFLIAYLILFADPGLASILGIERSLIEPAWSRGTWKETWPAFSLILAMVAVLFAVSLIDAKTFLIPIEILWGLSLLALVTHSVHAGVLGEMFRAGGENLWWIPLPADDLVYPTLAAALGLALAIALLKLKVLPQSYADYEAWEQEQRAARSDTPTAPSDQQTNDSDDLADRDQSSHEHTDSPLAAILRACVIAVPGVSGLVLGQRFIPQSVIPPTAAMLIGGAIGLAIGFTMRMMLVQQRGEADAPALHTDHPIEDWTLYPHARRESFKELLFVFLPALSFAAAFFIIPAADDSTPLWLRALSGSVLGFLAGGGVVWGVRILASIAFGKEAMGLGDVHLMAAVGAVVGWIAPTLAFFVAPFFGILVAIIGSIMPKGTRSGPAHAIPYGPSLALASVLIVLASPTVERILSALVNREIQLP